MLVTAGITRVHSSVRETENALRSQAKHSNTRKSGELFAHNSRISATGFCAFQRSRHAFDEFAGMLPHFNDRSENQSAGGVPNVVDCNRKRIPS